MILLTIDTSAASESAIATAVDLAAKFGRRLRVLLVLDGPLRHHFDELARQHGTTLDTEAEQYVVSVVARIRADAPEGVAVDAAVEHASDAGTGIVAAAEAGDVDMLVMATHRRSGISRWLTGSVTEHVVRASPVPVVAVPAR